MSHLLNEMISTRTAFDAAGNRVELHSGLGLNAARKIGKLVKEINAKRTLEVGMAMGCSTLAILEALGPDAHHTSIDPNQTSTAADGWAGIGLESVRRAGYVNGVRLIEDPSYLALPDLLRLNERFDFILIDGWHSYDYTFVDYFYSDLLLTEGGVLVIDDWGMPQVYNVTRFIETHKAYERLGPKTADPLGLRFRLRNLRDRLRSTSIHESEWGSIVAYRKLRSTQVPWHFYQSRFYPNYRIYKLWAKLRRHAVVKPY